MDVEIKDMPELRVGSVPHVGPYNQIPQAFGRLGDLAGSAGLFEQPGAAMIAVYHDDPDLVPESQLHADAGVIVPKEVALPRGLEEHRVAGGRYARTVHIGPYEQLPDIWHRLKGEWLPASGQRAARGDSYEIYRNDPRSTPKERLQTDLYLRIVG